MHGIQAWVALPRELEETAPAFAHYAARRPADVRGRRPVGAAGRRRGVRRQGDGKHPFAAVLCPLAPGGGRARPARGALPRARGLCRRRARSRSKARCSTRARCSCSRPASRCCSRQSDPPSSCCSAASRWASASSSGTSSRRRRTRIEQAKADWRAGRMKLPDPDDAEFIPLPPDPAPPANPMS